MSTTTSSFIQNFIAFFKTQLSSSLFKQIQNAAPEVTLVLFENLKPHCPNLFVGILERHSVHMNQEEQRHVISHMVLLLDHHSYDLQGIDAVENWTQSWNIDTNWTHRFDLLEYTYFPYEVFPELNEALLDRLNPIVKDAVRKFLDEHTLIPS